MNKWKNMDPSSIDIDSLGCGVNPDNAIELAKNYQRKIKNHHNKAGKAAICALAKSDVSEIYTDYRSITRHELLKAKIWSIALIALLDTFFRIKE